MVGLAFPQSAIMPPRRRPAAVAAADATVARTLSLPPELLHRICELASGEDVAASHARTTLATLRLVCKSLCRVASKVAHGHAVATSAGGAAGLLNAVLLDTKGAKSASESSFGQTTFFAGDIHALTLSDSGQVQYPIASRINLRLHVAFNRLPNLACLTWRMPVRPTMEALRALGKRKRLTVLELHDSGDAQDLRDKPWDVQFPNVALCATLTHLTLRLNPAVIVAASYERFARSLGEIAGLQSLAVELMSRCAESCHANADSLLANQWPALRAFATHRFGSTPLLMAFLERHPQLEMLEMNFGQLSYYERMIWPEVQHLMEFPDIGDPILWPRKLQTLVLDGDAYNADFFIVHLLATQIVQRVGTLTLDLVNMFQRFRSLTTPAALRFAQRSDRVESVVIGIREYTHMLDDDIFCSHIFSAFPNLKELQFNFSWPPNGLWVRPRRLFLRIFGLPTLCAEYRRRFIGSMYVAVVVARGCYIPRGRGTIRREDCDRPRDTNCSSRTQSSSSAAWGSIAVRGCSQSLLARRSV